MEGNSAEPASVVENPSGTTAVAGTSTRATNLSRDDFKTDSSDSEAYSGDSDFGDDIHDDKNKNNDQQPTVEQAVVRATSQPLINARTTLKNCHRFRKPEVESTLHLTLVNPKPYQTTLKPLFELADVAEQYRKMEKDMMELYNSITPDPILHPHQIRKGHYAVLIDCMNTLNRIRFLREPRNESVRIELIDYYCKMDVDVNSQFLQLDERFTTLPPRVTAIQMEGMSKYVQHEIFKQFSSHENQNFLFEGILTAEVQTSGKVVIWSDMFPQDQFPYGINQFITQVFIDELQEPKLPQLGEKMNDAFVVHATSSEVSLQIQSIAGDHFQEIFNSISNEDITKVTGAVRLTTNQALNQKYFVTHEVYGEYFRATILSRIGKDKVRVRYIDYGDEGTANVKDMARCSDVHPLLELFPPQCIKARLQNVENLDAKAYFDKYHRKDQPYSVQVVKNAFENSLAEVVLWLKEEAKSLNEKIVEDKFGTPINPSYKPGTVLAHSDLCRNRFTLHMVLDKGVRLISGLPLDVNVSYHRSIETMCFISLFSQQQAFREFEEQIKEDYELTWSVNESIYKAAWVKGSPMLCYSLELKKVARAMLITNIHDFHGVGEDGLTIAIQTGWLVYLIDHGILEIVQHSQFRLMMPNFMSVPVFGIRARFNGFDTQEKILQWATSWGSRTKRFNVLVQSASQDELGEIARVVLRKEDE
ncbi:unnamed protein product [Orchesella dallaii]|uniref:Tudor domain-containing protein n=1 Tax=Orchesella dallaii TaxID=48710 RepID=A0ABP1PZT4_9HEXA